MGRFQSADIGNPPLYLTDNVLALLYLMFKLVKCLLIFLVTNSVLSSTKELYIYPIKRDEILEKLELFMDRICPFRSYMGSQSYERAPTTAAVGRMVA